MMQSDLKKIRVFELAKAFSIIAANPARTLDFAVEVEDQTVTMIADNLHALAQRMNGDPLAHEIEALVSIPAFNAPSIVHERDVRAEEPDPDAFEWRSVRNASPNAALGDKFTAWTCDWKGVKLRIEKHGPGKYEGFADGQHVAASKFRRNVRERLEKEAAKRANA
jgi:hypothetical protein